MRLFILKVLYFLFPLVVVGIAGDFLVSGLLKQSKTFASGECTTWDDIYSGKINSDLLIYGSSRAVVQIDPSIIQDSLGVSCYNLGIDGHNFWMQYFRHDQYLKHNQTPKVIIHSLDVTTLEERGELFNSEQFLPYMLFDKSIETATRQYPVFSFFDFRVPLVRYLGKEVALTHAMKLSLGEQPDSVGRIKGYKSENMSWNADLANAQTRMPFYEVRIDSGALSLFEGFLNDCRKKDIRVILVYTPHHVDGQHFIKNKNEILDKYRQLSHKYNIPFLDYSQDSICHSKAYFYNSNHLNKNGSEVFTRILAHDLKVLSRH